MDKAISINKIPRNQTPLNKIPRNQTPRNQTPPAGPLEYSRKLWLKIIVVVSLLTLYAPIVLLIIYSFNDSKRNIVWRGFTTKYYNKAWNNDHLIEAFINSLIIAVANTFFAVILGVLAAVLLWRFRFPFKPLFEGVIMLPIVIPEICLGVALLVFFNYVQWPNDLIWPFNLSNIMISHVAFSFPFVAVIVRGRLEGYNRDLEDASFDLGASEWQTFRYVMLPYLKPGIIAGALIAFTLSLDDFVITFFTSGPNTITLPVKIFSMLRFSVTPEVNAASTILIIITILVIGIAMKYYNPADGSVHKTPATDKH